MYPANQYAGPEFSSGQFQGQMIPASDMGPPVIQFNFFGQDSQFPNFLSGLNFTNESDSDRDSDYNCGAGLEKDPQGYPFSCSLLNENNFARDLNNNRPEDATDRLHTRREFVTQGNPRKFYSKENQNLPQTGGPRNLPTQNRRNPTDWKDPNRSSGYLRQPVGKSFNAPYHGQESDVMKACLSAAGSRQDKPLHYTGARLEPNERHRLDKLHERNISYLPPLHDPNILCGGNVANSAYDDAKESYNHDCSGDPTIILERDKFAKPGIHQPKGTSESVITRPDDKKPAVAKYDLTNCRYCRVAKQPYDHPLYNDQREVVCAKLSQYKCPFCNATGKQAHTLKYCKENPILRGELAAIKKLGKGKAPEEHRDEAFRLKKRKLKCRYCRKLGKDFDHLFKDAEGVTCPELFKVVCELCGATGKKAHSKEYCKQAKSENLPDAGVAVSTSGIHVPEACDSAEPSGGGTTEIEVPTLTDLIPYKLIDNLASRRSFEDLHNSSTVLTSTLCVSEDDQSPEPTIERVHEITLLNSLQPVSEVLRNFDFLVHVKPGSEMPTASEVAHVEIEILAEAVEESPALAEAVEESPALAEAVEESPALAEAVGRESCCSHSVAPFW